ncbi:hypothetical protein AURANDRAFT_64877 [Aureococcus anophagefferens]|uniref:Uncharacterized protein n=1 Tax=Aureococcus anophagefferens TaxID=44056 RepID=F0YC26_AURAN|nr:hypothetical protein AURANDRAFT_64877 [Aureococcus anophagefferens]EGB07465.1 hypothetical protein AURANDRAFT_64877 [Aureococcus anophagefferens]|eukprot:XP_009038077.1 hypothetical protein AURANDRAFT_64877 [Aureococcus anophagefferens]
MWHSWGCSCGCTFSPIIYEEGSIHMDQHVFDQWNFSHAIWGFALGAVTHAPRSVAAWKIGFLFVLWEFWENVVEVAFSTYAPGQYMGDSVVNSVFDMIPSMLGVWLGRRGFGAWPLVVVAEVAATRAGFGIHSVFLGHQGSICDVRAPGEFGTCAQAYLVRLVVLPVLFSQLDGLLWRCLAARRRRAGAPSKAAFCPKAT